MTDNTHLQYMDEVLQEYGMINAARDKANEDKIKVIMAMLQDLQNQITQLQLKVQRLYERPTAEKKGKGLE